MDNSTNIIPSILSGDNFFDTEENKQKKIWTKIQDKDKQELNKLKQISQVLLADNFQKTTKKVGKYKEVYLILVNNMIYMAKNSKKNKLSGYIELLECRCEWVMDQNQIGNQNNNNLKNKNVLGFRLKYRDCTQIFFTENLIVFEQWRQQMYSMVLQSNFHDDFIVHKMIGRGSFAKVYLASKKENNKQYAVKAFNKEYMKNQHRGVESIKNEIFIMKQLNNPYLLSLFEVYETTNSIYFIVDILQGGELLSNVGNDKQFSTINIQCIMKNLLTALNHLHEQNIMHRDLKPENVLIRTQGQYDIVVADFGLATQFQDPDKIIFKRCGTPGFVAPEILQYDEKQEFYDNKCDLFSAGVIMHILITGKQPFIGSDYKQILRANKNCQIDFNAQIFQNCNQLALDLLKKLLEPQPTNRYDAYKALQHSFFKLEPEKIKLMEKREEQIKKQQNIINQHQEYKKKLQQNKIDSKEQVGSLALKQTSQNAMNGNINTVGSLNINSKGKFDSNLQLNTNSRENLRNPNKKMSNFSKDMNSSSERQKKKKKTQQRLSKNLHKLAIKNNLYKQQQQDEEDQYNQQNQNDLDKDSYINEDEFDLEDEFEVSEESPSNQIDQQLKKMNFDSIVNMSKLSKGSLNSDQTASGSPPVIKRKLKSELTVMNNSVRIQSKQEEENDRTENENDFLENE